LDMTGSCGKDGAGSNNEFVNQLILLLW